MSETSDLTFASSKFEFSITLGSIVVRALMDQTQHLTLVWQQEFVVELVV